MKRRLNILACSWGLPRPIIKSHPEEKVGWPWVRGAPQNFGFPYKISATAGLGTSSLARLKSRHIITRRRKAGGGSGLGELPNICGFPSVFTQWLKLGTSNLVHTLGLPRSTIKPHPEEKWAWPWPSEAS